MIELRQWNVVEHLNTQEDMVLYLGACHEENDPALVAAALGDIAKAEKRQTEGGV